MLIASSLFFSDDQVSLVHRDETWPGLVTVFSSWLIRLARCEFVPVKVAKRINDTLGRSATVTDVAENLVTGGIEHDNSRSATHVVFFPKLAVLLAKLRGKLGFSRIVDQQADEFFLSKSFKNLLGQDLLAEMNAVRTDISVGELNEDELVIRTSLGQCRIIVGFPLGIEILRCTGGESGNQKGDGGRKEFFHGVVFGYICISHGAGEVVGRNSPS